MALAWWMVALVGAGEVVGLINRGEAFGWLGLSVAGIALALYVPVLDRAEQSDFAPPSTVGLLLLFVLPFLIIVSLPGGIWIKNLALLGYAVVIVGIVIHDSKS